MEHFVTPFLTIHWDEEREFVRMEWQKFVKGEGFRNGLDRGLELAIKKNTSKWLADLRKLKVVDKEDQEWSNENWFPRAIKGGIKLMAIIVPEDIFAKMSLNSIMSKVPATDLAVHYFEEDDEAIDWLSKN